MQAPKFITIIAFVLSTLVTCRAQNLIPNPSFEDTVTCPTYIGQIPYAVGWYSANSGSPDYFNSCYDGTANAPPDIPNNFWGFQYARTGEAYAGFGGYFARDSFGCREYISIRLNDSLRPGSQYCLEMYVALADSIPLAVNKIGMYLSRSNDTMYQDQWGNSWCGALPYVADWECDSIVRDSIAWTKLSGTIVADGGEQFLIIGVFAVGADILVDTLYGNGFNALGYYYVDDVAIYPCDPPVYSEISLFPNPNHGNFTITGNFPIGTELKIYNVLGQQVSNTISLPEGNQNVPIYSFLAAGVYCCRIESQGVILKSEMIVVSE